MSRLVIVRHGQASFLSDDYDVLSPHGETQALKLGEYWAAIGLNFDAIYTGPRIRQQRTAELAGRAVRRADLAWPEPTALPAWDEHQVDRLMLDHGPAIV